MKVKKIGIKMLAISLILAMLCFGVLLYIEYKILSNYEKTDVVRAKTSIDAGTEITEENISEYFEVVSIPLTDKVDKACTTLEEVGNVFMSYPMEKGEQLITTKYVSLKNDVLDEYTMPCEISYEVDSAAQAVSGTLRRGDYVAAYRYDADLGTMEQISDKLFISGAYNASGAEISEVDVNSSEQASIMFNFIIESEEFDEMQAMFEQGNVVLVKVEGVK